MRGRIPPNEDAWLYRKWKAEVDVDSLLQATLPLGPVEDEVDSYEAFVLASRVSELSNAATPEQDAVVPVLATPSNVAKPLHFRGGGYCYPCGSSTDGDPPDARR